MRHETITLLGCYLHQILPKRIRLQWNRQSLIWHSLLVEFILLCNCCCRFDVPQVEYFRYHRKEHTIEDHVSYSFLHALTILHLESMMLEKLNEFKCTKQNEKFTSNFKSNRKSTLCTRVSVLVTPPSSLFRALCTVHVYFVPKDDILKEARTQCAMWQILYAKR